MPRSFVSSSDYRAFITEMVRVRQAAGVSQRELARRLGKPPSFINKIELMERRLDVVEFVSIAGALNIAADKLLREIVAAQVGTSSA